MAKSRVGPGAIATWKTGLVAVRAAGQVLIAGGSALDAVEKGINLVELDPDVRSVGYGGWPNAEGIVELDAAIMDGRTHDAGSVAALRRIRRPISVARRVMEASQHAMLVADGALAFALSHGFSAKDLLTQESMAKWREWQRDEQAGSPTPHDTIGLVALDGEGDIACGCSTSGRPYKSPGRVGDSPLIGSGLYVDNDVGGAAATGLGEEILKFCASFLVVEQMRNGHSPTDACRRTIERILRKKPQTREVTIGLVALNGCGESGAACTRSGFEYAVWGRHRCELRVA